MDKHVVTALFCLLLSFLLLVTIYQVKVLESHVSAIEQRFK